MSFSLDCYDKTDFPFPCLTTDLHILSKEKKSVCCEYIFLKATSSELFMNVLAGSFIVVKLLAVLRNITRYFQGIYVIVLNLGSICQVLKFLIKEGGHSPQIYRVLIVLTGQKEPLTRSAHRRLSVLFLARVSDTFQQQAI